MYSVHSLYFHHCTDVGVQDFKGLIYFFMYSFSPSPAKVVEIIKTPNIVWLIYVFVSLSKAVVCNRATDDDSECLSVAA